MTEKKLFLILIVCLLQSSIVSAQVQPVIFKGWSKSPPTINGELDEDEWSYAGRFEFTTINGGFGPGQQKGILYVMNNEKSLFIAVKVFDSVMDNNDYVEFRFAQIKDNKVNNYDGLVISATPNYFRHDYFIRDVNKWYEGWVFDTSDGGKDNFVAYVKQYSDYIVYEIAKPLQTGDEKYDMTLQYGDTIYFVMRLKTVDGNEGMWPNGNLIPGSEAQILITGPLADSSEILPRAQQTAPTTTQPTTQQPQSGVPGFPLETILIGVVIGVISSFILKRNK